MTAAPAPLSTQLQATARCVLAVQQGQSLSDVLPRVEASLRPGVQALTFHVLRHWGMASALARLLADRAPAPAALALMHCALALLLPASAADAEAPAWTSGAAYAEHTVVNQAVQAAKSDPKLMRTAAFLNACLRRYLRERVDLLAEVALDPVAVHNHPLWWIERVQRDHPEHWRAILAANNQAAPMALRVNPRRTTPAQLQAALLAQGVESQAFGDHGLVLHRALPVQRIPGFEQGDCSVQDAAAQWAGRLLLQGSNLPKGARLLDACAAPGGKTADVLERADVQMLALDVDPVRAERVGANLTRLGLSGQVRVADAAEVSTWWTGAPFDAILLDAPCTASGIVRRHPDVRWLRRESDVQQLVATQRRLLKALWPLVKPGGRLLYATCSVFKAEGEDQIRRFVKDHADAVLQPSLGHLLPGASAPGGEFNDNPLGGYDGFFYARLDKAHA
ncbi:MAG: rRNA ((967)-C(5))-methyltransferase [Pseudomonadota bacterium]